MNPPNTLKRPADKISSSKLIDLSEPVKKPKLINSDTFISKIKIINNQTLESLQNKLNLEHDQKINDQKRSARSKIRLGEKFTILCENHPHEMANLCAHFKKSHVSDPKFVKDLKLNLIEFVKEHGNSFTMTKNNESVVIPEMNSHEQNKNLLLKICDEYPSEISNIFEHILDQHILNKYFVKLLHLKLKYFTSHYDYDLGVISAKSNSESMKSYTSLREPLKTALSGFNGVPVKTSFMFGESDNKPLEPPFNGSLFSFGKSNDNPHVSPFRTAFQ